MDKNTRNVFLAIAVILVGIFALGLVQFQNEQASSPNPQNLILPSPSTDTLNN